MSLTYVPVNAMDPEPAPQRDRPKMSSMIHQSNPSCFCPVRFFGLPVLLFIVALLAACQSGGERMVPPLPVTGSNEVYRLRVGDAILLEVFQEPYMTTRQKILGDGTISVGLIGRVVVAGLDINQAAKKIASQLNEKQLVNPQVTISVEGYAPRRFTVWGQVRTPGAYVIPGEEQLTLPQALAMAGGNTDIGDIRNVEVTRRSNGGTQKIKLNALSPSSTDFLIQEGDTVFVKETLF